MTASDLVELFLAWIEKNRSKDTYESRRTHCSRFINFRVGSRQNRIADFPANKVGTPISKRGWSILKRAAWAIKPAALDAFDVPSVSWTSAHRFRILCAGVQPIPRENGKRDGYCPAAPRCEMPTVQQPEVSERYPCSSQESRIVAASFVQTSFGRPETIETSSMRRRLNSSIAVSNY